MFCEKWQLVDICLRGILSTLKVGWRQVQVLIRDLRGLRLLRVLRLLLVLRLLQILRLLRDFGCCAGADCLGCAIIGCSELRD